MKKTISMLLLFMLVAVSFAACGGNIKSTSGSTSSDGSVSTSGTDKKERYDENGYLMDDLPVELNYSAGETPKDVNIFSWSESRHWEWNDDSSSNDSVKYALYQRQITVQERLGIKLKFTFQAGNWDNRIQFVKSIENYQMDQSGAFDIIASYTPAAAMAASNNYFAPLESEDISTYLDLEKPWWPDSISSISKIGDHIYFATGDITTTHVKNIHCMFVNLTMFGDLNISANMLEGKSIYDVVNSGDWTLEELKRLSLGVVGDMYGVGEVAGFTMADHISSDAFFFSAGFTLTNNENGVLSLSSDLTSMRLNNWFEEVQKLYTLQHNDLKIDYNNVFKAGKSLFYTRLITDALIFSQQEGLNFGIIPLPKFDAEQEEYTTIANMWVTLFSVPKDAKNKTMSGAVLEALASDGYRSITNEVFYEAFIYKYLTTTDNEDMFNLIQKNVIYDTGRTFADALSMFSAFRNGVNDTQSTWGAIYQQRSEEWIKKLSKLYTSVG